MENGMSIKYRYRLDRLTATVYGQVDRSSWLSTWIKIFREFNNPRFFILKWCPKLFFANFVPYRKDKSSLARSKSCSRASKTSKLTSRLFETVRYQKTKKTRFELLTGVEMMLWTVPIRWEKWVYNFYKLYQTLVHTFCTRLCNFQHRFSD